MPSTTTVQTRISAFETLSTTGRRPPPSPSPSPSPPNLGRRTSLIDLKDWIVDDGHGIDSTKTPTQPLFNAPLISLDSAPPKPRKPANLRVGPPRLPPRKSSYTSLQSLASSSSSPPADSLTVYPPRSHAPSSSISSFHSVSLSSDTSDPSTPDSVANFIATFPMDSAEDSQLHSDSISLTESYEEIDWEKARLPPKLPQRPRPSFKATPPPSHPVSRTASLSGSSPTSPILRPALSAAAAASSSSLALNPPYTPRRAAPPPPPSRSSDRSSIRSIATTNSYSSSSQSHSQPQPHVHHTPSLLSLKTKRPTPVPLAARKRYEAVFANNIIQRRRVEKRTSQSSDKPALLSPGEARGRRAVGWRGLSVDLITGDNLAPQSPTSDDSVDENISADDKLEASIVRLIWKRSGLSSSQLADIWNECDITGKGALSLEAFVKGMWRIDEELRRAQTHAIKSATNGAAAYRSNSLRSPHKAPHRPRDILR